jgi:glycosyltransferase involved in cell wall biosynthesis
LGIPTLFENKSVDDLLEQLTMLLVTPKRVAQAGEQLHAMVKQQYNWETITDETENVYRSTFSTVETLHDQAVKRLSTK